MAPPFADSLLCPFTVTQLYPIETIVKAVADWQSGNIAFDHSDNLEFLSNINCRKPPNLTNVNDFYLLISVKLKSVKKSVKLMSFRKKYILKQKLQSMSIEDCTFCLQALANW